MATAYSTLLGLALPVTGELSGTWGDTVNNSITSLLDSAIAGTTTLSSDADVTLTNLDGTADTSRQAILLWTAGGTVTRTVIAPALSKIYTVINASSSTQSIKVTGPGPTTGVTIIKGEAAMIAWNGSDFVKVSNTGGSFTTQDLTVTGNTILGDAITDTTTLNAQTRFLSRAILGYANMTGPAATSLSTTAPAFLFSGATTYTVSDVSGGTQTFAPIISLGQATITNATTNTIYTNAPTMYIGGTPNASTNITFTRPYALYLDSGTTTAAAAVTYTNAATLYINGAPTAGSNVTLTTPYALYVNAGNVYLGGGTANGVAYLDTNKVLTTGSALVFDGTSFGLSISQNAATKATLTNSNAGVSASARYEANNGSNTAEFGIRGSAQTTNGVLAPQVGYMYSPSSAGLALVGAAGPILFSAGGTTESMRIDSSGNLGIGTTSPSAKLNVSSTGNGYRALFDDTTNDNTLGIYSDSTDFRLINLNNARSSYKRLGFQSNVIVFSASNGSESARIDTSGNLLVGTTTPIFNAAGRGLITINGSSAAALGFTAGAVDKGIILHTGTDMIMSNSVSGAITFQTNNTERARIDTSGQMQFTTTQGVAQISNTISASFANGATLDFTNFSGMIIVSNWSTGNVGMFITGGGAVTLVSSISSSYGTITYPATFDGYRWTNNTGATYTFSFTAIRYRPNA